MNHEEIDRLLGELPAQARASVNRSDGALEAVMAETWSAIQSSRAAAVEPVQPDRARGDRARQRIERVGQARAAQAPRIRARLAAALQRTRTPCALLLGPTGIGKTSAMHWLAAEWPGYHVHARELASSERRHGLGEGYPPEMNRARDTPVLYLDDVGAEEARDLAALQFLLDHRYSRGLPMVATSGLTESELRAHLGAPYLRRLTDQHVKKRDGSEWPVLFVDCHEVRP